MTTLTATSQAELDAALTDPDVTEVWIDSPRHVGIVLSDTRGKYVGVTGSATVPARVRELYPDVKVYPSIEAAVAAHPLVKPELPSPESDPEFWQRAL